MQRDTIWVHICFVKSTLQLSKLRWEEYQNFVELLETGRKENVAKSKFLVFVNNFALPRFEFACGVNEHIGTKSASATFLVTTIFVPMDTWKSKTNAVQID